MKETVNVSIASQAFTLDDDAWQLLKEYLRAIRERIDPGDTETVADIEARIADIFCESLSSHMMVVSAALVRNVMAQIGNPEIFGEPRTADGKADDGAAWEGRTQNGQLRRSRESRLLAGVCGGLADYFGLDATVMRLIMLLLITVGGLSVWVYVILWLLIPEEPVNFQYNERR